MNIISTDFLETLKEMVDYNKQQRRKTADDPNVIDLSVSESESEEDSEVVVGPPPAFARSPRPLSVIKNRSPNGTVGSGAKNSPLTKGKGFGFTLRLQPAELPRGESKILTGSDVDEQDFKTIFRKLKREVKNKRTNVLAFERAIDQTSESKSHSGRPKSTRRSEESHIDFTSRKIERIQSKFDMSDDESKSKGPTEKAYTRNRSQRSITVAPRLVTQVSQMISGVLPEVEIPSSPLPQQEINLTKEPLVPQLTITTSNQRRRSSLMPGLNPKNFIMNKNVPRSKQQKKAADLIGLDNVKHEWKQFNPNPNKQKNFEFKPKQVEPESLDERTLIKLDDVTLGGIQMDHFNGSVKITIHFFEYGFSETIFVKLKNDSRNFNSASCIQVLCQVQR